MDFFVGSLFSSILTKVFTIWRNEGIRNTKLLFLLLTSLHQTLVSGYGFLYLFNCFQKFSVHRRNRRCKI